MHKKKERERYRRENQIKFIRIFFKADLKKENFTLAKKKSIQKLLNFFFIRPNHFAISQYPKEELGKKYLKSVLSIHSEFIKSLLPPLCVAGCLPFPLHHLDVCEYVFNEIYWPGNDCTWVACEIFPLHSPHSLSCVWCETWKCSRATFFFYIFFKYTLLFYILFKKKFIFALFRSRFCSLPPCCLLPPSLLLHPHIALVENKFLWTFFFWCINHALRYCFYRFFFCVAVKVWE